MKCFRSGAMMLNKLKRLCLKARTLVIFKIYLWEWLLVFYFWKLNQLHLFGYLARMLWPPRFSKSGDCVNCSSVLRPARFPRCARFSGVEERKRFLCKVDSIACADLAASVSVPSSPDFVLCSTGLDRICTYQLFPYNSLCPASLPL